MNIAVRYAQIYLLLLAIIFPLCASSVFAQESLDTAGVQWEMSSQVTMEGMPFAPPAQSFKRCMAAEWSEPPRMEDDGRGCVNSSFDRLDNTVTWTSTCAGPPEMAGQGEIVFADETAQAYSGKLHYATNKGSVVIVLSGKVIGSCDNPR